ncbi:amino acid ABC transporter ATP-binding/permease protein [Leptospira interrogans]
MTGIMRQLRPITDLFLSDNRGMLLSGALLAAVTALCGIALLGLSGWFITATSIAGLSVATAIVFDVFAPSAGIRFLALARTAARYGERLTTHEATLRILAALRERLFRGWAASGAANDLMKRPARLLFRLTLDIDALDSLYLRVLVPLFGAICIALASGIAFGLMQPLLGLGIAVFLVMAGIGITRAGALAADRPARRRGHGLEIFRSRIIDLMTGKTEWIMAGQLHDREEGIAAVDRYLADNDDALNRIETGVGVGFGIVSALLLSTILIAMAMLVETGSISMPVAALGLLVGLALLEPFAALRRGVIELGRTLLAARRIAPRLAVVAAPSTAQPPAEPYAVVLDRVAVRHSGTATPALQNVSVSIRSGERVAVVGPSGAGKSTLLALLAGEIDAEAGRVEYRQATLLTQRTELFQDTLRDNLRLADPCADDVRLRQALDAAGLHRDIEALTEGLNTRLGEGGHGLSGGQARRLALARLFLRDTPVWLLDEPTEGLDGPTARDVLARLDSAAGRRTIVTATHIRREAESADCLIVMKRGTVAGIIGRDEPDFETALASLRPD